MVSRFSGLLMRSQLKLNPTRFSSSLFVSSNVPSLVRVSTWSASSRANPRTRITAAQKARRAKAVQAAKAARAAKVARAKKAAQVRKERSKVARENQKARKLQQKEKAKARAQVLKERKQARKAAAKAKQALKKANKLTSKEKKVLKKFPDPKRPSQPPTGYLLFMKSKFASLKQPGLSIVNGFNGFNGLNGVNGAKVKPSVHIKNFSQQWKSLNETEKQRFNSQAKVEQDKYKQLIKNYNKVESQKQWLKVIVPMVKNKPPKSGYSGFVAQKMKDKKVQSGEKISENLKKVAQEWKTLNPVEKRQINERFTKQYQTWRDQVNRLYSQ